MKVKDLIAEKSPCILQQKVNELTLLVKDIKSRWMRQSKSATERKRCSRHQFPGTEPGPVRPVRGGIRAVG